MSRRFSIADPDFDTAFAAFLREPRGGGDSVNAAVADVLAAVRTEGLPAVLRYAAAFDRFNGGEAQLRVTAAEVEAGAAACAPEVREAIAFAARRIRAYHERQRPADARWTDEVGAELGWRWSALESVGVYVPGGAAAYPSSLLMNVIPAQVAGVDRIAAITPPGRLSPAVLAAAAEVGLSEIWRVGGAHGVAALAYGAGPIAAVDKITGPGGVWVVAAKRQVYGVVGIDSLAGPSEIVVVADGANDPDWIAADLLSQAEHDPAAQSLLITDDAAFADRVEAAIAHQLETLPTRETAAASWRDHGAVVLIRNLDEAPALVDRIAPEHVEFAIDDPDRLADRVRHAGAIFLGRHAPEALGDYVAGSNHVLPTSRAARFSSGLSVYDFLKRTSLLRVDAEAFAALADATAVLADAEGLPAHAASVRVRTGPV